MKLRPTAGLMGLVTALVLCAGQANAISITVADYSFEDGYPPVGIFGCGGSCNYSVGEVQGWVLSPSSSGGRSHPGDSGVFNYLQDGQVIAYSTGGTISQVVSDTSIAGATYTLQVYVGALGGNAASVSGAALAVEQLIIGGVPTIATGIVPTAGNWGLFTATYVAPTSGLSIEIALSLPSGTGKQADWDLVSLSYETTTAVPGPIAGAGIPGLVAAFGALVALARRRRHQAV